MCMKVRILKRKTKKKDIPHNCCKLINAMNTARSKQKNIFNNL